MRKTLSIVIVVAVALAAAAPATADPSSVERLIAQERAKGLIEKDTSPTTIDAIRDQEQGRKHDARLFGPAVQPPIQVVARGDDGFRFVDAGIGAAAALALALLGGAAIALRSTMRQRTSGEAPGLGNPPSLETH